MSVWTSSHLVVLVEHRGCAPPSPPAAAWLAFPTAALAAKRFRAATLSTALLFERSDRAIRNAQRSAGGGVTVTAWAAQWSESWGLDDRDGPPSRSGKAAPAPAEVGFGHHVTPTQACGRRGVPAAPPVGALAAARSPRRRRTEEIVRPKRLEEGGGGGIPGEGAGVRARPAPPGARYGAYASSAAGGGS